MNQKQQMLDNAIAGMKNPATRKAFEDAISANRVRRLSDQLNTKLVCDNRDFQAAVMTGELKQCSHLKFVGPEVSDFWIITLVDASKDLKLNLRSMQRAALAKRLVAWKCDGEYVTKLVHVREWIEKYPAPRKK